ncbi:UvrD-helicase domain-containing protein [Mucilaginibacter aquariorum]|uniref:ATP-dependent helicase n=1 Tax=Mucilaginibacter aquariorum TaxID=2967225 RepID=A0ABT1T7A0_9SPHI|nr:ATP-dependent helicase [Mucilaginibacter aquariorum]MCQ6960111.1 ATP-dependent helicase [Mucilaginibacter aquariorum]
MMEFEINDDNRPYLEARGKIVLNACPGSGKTTAVAYKLTELSKECAAAYGDFAGIACLSFTNVAKEEIAEKFHRLTGSHFDYPHEVATLDSFVNQYITLPFYYLLGKPTQRPIIMNVVSFLDEMNLGNFKAVSKQPLTKILAPSKLKIEMDGTVTWKGTIPKPQTVDAATFIQYGKAFKSWQINNGYLNNDDSTYIAYKLLKKHPQISKSLIARFPYMIIDEAQDTSEIQYAILDLLASAGLSNIEYVGDPYQSLYEFREARPDLFLDRFRDTANWQPFRLKDCRRTSQKIIDTYSIFRDAAEINIVSTCKHTSDHQVKVLRYDPADLDDLIARYETLIDPELKNHILVRGTTHLEMFGAKPSSEEPWKNGAAKTLIEAQTYFNAGDTKGAVGAIRMFLAEIQIPAGTHRQKRDQRDQLKIDTDLNILLFDFLRGMPSLNNTLKDWTQKVTDHVLAIFKISVNLGLKQKGQAFHQQNLQSLLSPATNVPYPVSTIHKVKGMTFQSVLLVLSEDSTAARLSLKDFSKPVSLPSEKQRMIYVALSRPELLACIAVPNVITEDEIITVLGNNIDFV